MAHPVQSAVAVGVGVLILVPALLVLWPPDRRGRRDCGRVGRWLQSARQQVRQRPVAAWDVILSGVAVAGAGLVVFGALNLLGVTDLD